MNKVVARFLKTFKDKQQCSNLNSIRAFQTSKFNSKLDKVKQENSILFGRNSLELIAKLNDRNDFSISKTMPLVWLRNKCKCEKCYNSHTEEVELDLTEIPVDIKLEKFNFVDADKLEVRWCDGHLSKYSTNEIVSEALANEIRKKMNIKENFLWNKEIMNSKGCLKVFDYEKYMNDEKCLSETLSCVKKYGAVLLENVPVNYKEIVNATERIAPIQSSIFGKDCVVTNQLGFVDRAYTSLKLKAHTDNVYLRNCAGLEIFHIVNKAEEGGDSLLIDGFYCAEQLRDEFPKEFEILTKTIVQAEFYKKGQFDLKYADPLIKLDPITDQIQQIRFNAYNKYALDHLSKEEIENFYEALKKFIGILGRIENQFWISLNPNQILIFDNFRLLHGRSEFKGNRVLITTYVSRDEWLSKAAILKEKYQN